MFQKISQESVNNFQGGSTDIEVEPVILPKVPVCSKWIYEDEL